MAGYAVMDSYIVSKFSEVVRGPEDMRPYQNTAVQFMLDNPFSALFVDVGMGKSVISLTAMMRIITEIGDFSPWLIIAPVRVANETWPTEIGQWSHTAPLTYVHIREDDVVDAVNRAGRDERKRIEDECLWKAMSRAQIKEKVKGKESSDRIEKARLMASRKAVRDHFKNNPATVHIINREQVDFLIDAWGKEFPYRNVLIDESSSLKDHKTNRFKALKRVRPLLKRMHQLTATPAAETYLHLFAQIYLLDQGERLGRSITAYREEYFTQNRYTYKYSIRPGAEERISEKIADICLVLKAEDYLDLEKPVVIKEKVTLSDESLALYRKMEDDFVITLPDGTEIEAETAAALSQKLVQMASGVIYQTLLEEAPSGDLKRRRVTHLLHDDKIEKLQTIVEETDGECLMVCYWHESSLARLKEAFPKAVVMDKAGKCVKPWNARKIKLMLVHPASAGHGLNMQLGGRRIVFFDLPYSLELYQQVIGRLAGARQLARVISERVVFLHHIIAEGTIDEDIVDGLAEKRDMQELLFTLIKKIRKNRRKQALSRDDEL